MDALTLRNTIFIIGAIIMAIGQGLRSAPEFRSRLPRFIASERWNFAPLILMIIAGAIWVVRSWEAPKQKEITSAAHSQQPAIWCRPRQRFDRAEAPFKATITSAQHGPRNSLKS
jgi:hypothetical protein